MPTVTWILPVKNGMPYLPETLASIEQQTFKQYELLVWDNGSTDGTLEVLRQWIPARIPGQIVTGQPRGVGGALAGLVELSQAEFCARIDADDVALPERLAKQMAFLERHPEVAVVGGQMEAIDAAGNSRGLMPAFAAGHNEIVFQLLAENPMGHPAVLFRRRAILEVGNYREIPNVEDYELWLRLACKHRFANLPEVVTKYRLHDRSCTLQLCKDNSMREKADAIVIEHSPALFGITPEEARRLRARGDYLTIVRAFKIARYFSRTQGGSTWNRLRNPSFVRHLRTLTPTGDLLSRFALALLDRKSGSVGEELRHLMNKAVSKLPLTMRLLENVRAWRAARQLKKWRRIQKSLGNIYSESISFIGQPAGHTTIKSGTGLYVEPDVTFWISNDQGAKAELTMGENVYLGRNTFLGVYQPISIGDHTIIGAYSYITSANHRYESRTTPIRNQGYVGAPIRIGEDVWIGTHVVILPGVTIGKGAIVAAGSLVNQNIPEFEIWGGVPARFIKARPE